MIRFFNFKDYFTMMIAALLGLHILVTSSFAEETVAKLDTNTVESIKQEILNDDNFINALKGKLKNTLFSEEDNKHIKQLVKEYLLGNPEIMLEVQDALNAKQETLKANQQKQIINSMKKDIYRSPHDAVIGNPNGAITLVEFYDYNCVYCKRAQADVDSLIKKNPDLRLVLKDFAILGPDSVKAHIVAQAFLRLMPEKYAQYHEELLLSEGKATEEKAINIAVKLGADKDKLLTMMKDKSLEEPLQTTMQIAYALEINGTPTFIIGDEMIVGAIGETRIQESINNLRNEQALQ